VSFKMLIIHSLVLQSLMCFTDSAFLHSQVPAQLVRTYPLDSLNNLVIHNLSVKRIVMLPDHYHGHGYYMGKVIDFLKFWIDYLQKDPGNQNNPHKLILFLEEGEPSIKAINEFIETGNLKRLIIFLFTKGHGDPFYPTIDEIKFYQQLKLIYTEVLTLNSRNKTMKTDLLLYGPESPPPCDKWNSKWTNEQECQRTVDLWFINDRDRLSSARIKDVMTEHPFHRGLIFYGSAHLNRKLCDKTVLCTIIKTPTYSYFMPHFLDSLIGRDQVVVFRQHIWEEDNQRVEQYSFDKEADDYNVLCRPHPDYPFPVYFIYSKATLHGLLDIMKIYIDYQSQTEKLRYISYATRFWWGLKRSYLYNDTLFKSKIDSIPYYSRLSKKDVSARSATVRLCEELINKYDAVDNIKNIDTWNISFTNDDRLFLQSLRTVLSNLQTSDMEDVHPKPELMPDTSLTDSERAQFNRLKDKIITYSLINLLWICDEQEKNDAMRCLKEITHMDFTTSTEWDQWWVSKNKLN